MPSVILQPNALGSHGNDWTQSGGASKVLAVDPGDPISHDDATSLVFSTKKAIRQSFKFETLTSQVPGAATVVSVRFYIRVRSVDCNPVNEVFFRSADASQVNTTQSGLVVLGSSQGFLDASAVLPPGDNGDWTLAKANGPIEIQWFINDPIGENGVIQITSTWLVVTYGETVTTVEAPDEGARRRLRRLRFEEDKFVLRCRPRAEQIGPWQDFHLVESTAPDDTGTGFGPDIVSARLLRPFRKTIDPGKNEITFDALDPRRFLTHFFISGVSDAPGKSIGTNRIDQGIVNTFTRTTKAWVEWKDGLVYEVATGEKKFTHKGLLLEKARTNRILNSAFHVDGAGGTDLFASWVEHASAAGLLATAPNPYFADFSVVKQHLRIQETNPWAGRGVNQTTSHSFGAGNSVVLAIAYRAGGLTPNAEILARVQNVTTGNWLQNDGSWSATANFLTWPQSEFTTRQAKIFTMEGTGSTLFLQLFARFTDDIVHIYQVDLIDDSNIVRSPVLTTTAEVTENADKDQYTNPLGLEAIPFTGEQFTIQCVMYPEFDSDIDLTVGGSQVHSVYILNAPGAPADSFLIYLQDSGTPGDNHFAFHLSESGGVKPAFVAGDRVKLVHRRSSSRGEHDLAASKDHLMVQVNDGVWLEGAQVAVVTMDPQTDCEFYFGTGTTGLEAPDAYIEYFDVRPYVLTKDEAKDFP